MTWTPDEAEQILREKWDGAESIGGFIHEWDRELARKELYAEFGAAIDPYTLIGLTVFCDYEEGETTTLWIKNEDNSLWMFRSGVSVYGNYGTTFDEIDHGDMAAWLSHVEANDRHAANFQGF